MSTITKQMIYDMVGDWLATPANHYLGSDYGQDLGALLHTPVSQALGNVQLAKLREDVTVLNLLPRDALNLFKTSQGPDKIQLIVDIAGHAMPVEV